MIILLLCNDTVEAVATYAKVTDEGPRCTDFGQELGIVQSEHLFGLRVAGLHSGAGAVTALPSTFVPASSTAQPLVQPLILRGRVKGLYR